MEDEKKIICLFASLRFRGKFSSAADYVTIKLNFHRLELIELIDNASVLNLILEQSQVNQDSPVWVQFSLNSVS